MAMKGQTNLLLQTTCIMWMFGSVYTLTILFYRDENCETMVPSPFQGVPNPLVASRRGMLTQMEGWCWACAWAYSRRWKGGVGLARGHARTDGREVLFAAVDAAVNIFKRRLQKDHPSNPWSPMVHHSMDHFIMAYPGLVQFLCVNR